MFATENETFKNYTFKNYVLSFSLKKEDQYKYCLHNYEILW